MKYDVIVIGGGASGLLAACSAAGSASAHGVPCSVCVLEKMPRPARKIMITGKGRCNFTNVKDWNAFSSHIRSGAQFVRAAWRSLPPERLAEWFHSSGMPFVVERGDRAYPASYRASDVVDTLVRECLGAGVIIQTGAEVAGVEIVPLAPLPLNDKPAPSPEENGAKPSEPAREGAAGQENGAKPSEPAREGAAGQENGAKPSEPAVGGTAGQENGAKPSEPAVGGTAGQENGAKPSEPAVGGTAGQENGAKRSGFRLLMADGSTHTCSRLIIATGGLSYPATGSTGDGFRWARSLGHTVTPTFPSLTALVPRGYKSAGEPTQAHHIPRETPLADFGRMLCGISLKNIGVTLLVQDTPAGEEFGDIDFTDGGIEGPVGFQLSRKAVKSMINGSRAALSLDLKPGVNLTELTTRIKELWEEIGKDPRSQRLREKERCRILLGKLMPWELIPAFTLAHPGIITLERRSRTDTKVWVNLVSIAKALKDWRFPLDGFVGWERAVITAGGVSTDEIVPKTMESRLVSGLYFCGEALDIDADTGGYNLQLAFCTGWLAGQNAVPIP